MFPGFRRASKCATQPGANEVSELTVRPRHHRRCARANVKFVMQPNMLWLCTSDYSNVRPRPGSATTSCSSARRSCALATCRRHLHRAASAGRRARIDAGVHAQQLTAPSACLRDFRDAAVRRRLRDLARTCPPGSAQTTGLIQSSAGYPSAAACVCVPRRRRIRDEQSRIV